MAGVLYAKVGTSWVPIGGAGAPGPPGPAGGSYMHQQAAAAAVWSISHNLGFYPGGLLVIDSAGTNVEGDIAHIDLNTTMISFSAAFAGTAYLS